MLCALLHCHYSLTVLPNTKMQLFLITGESATECASLFSLAIGIGKEKKHHHHQHHLLRFSFFLPAQVTFFDYYTLPPEMLMMVAAVVVATKKAIAVSFSYFCSSLVAWRPRWCRRHNVNKWRRVNQVSQSESAIDCAPAICIVSVDY